MRSPVAAFLDWLGQGCSPASSGEAYSEAQIYRTERRAELGHWLFMVRSGLALGVIVYFAIQTFLMDASPPTGALLVAAGYAGLNVGIRVVGGRQWFAAPWAYALTDFYLVLLMCSFYGDALGGTLAPSVVLVGLMALLLLVYTLLGDPALNATLSLAILGSVGGLFYLFPALGIGGSAGITGTPQTPMHAFVLVEYLSIACVVTCLLALRLRRRIEAYSTELHRRLEASLRADLEEDKNRQLEAVGQLKRDFIMVLSHELRNPIAPLVSSLEVVREDAYADCCNPELTDVALDSAREMQHLVGDYTQLAELLTRPLENTTRRNVSLAPLVEGTAACLTERSTSAAQFAFETLPGHAVASDPALLHAAMLALMRRASALAPAGAAVTVRSFAEGNAAGFAVHDPDSHLDPEAVASLDDLFAPSRERLYAKRATGLELLLARHALHRVGGELRAESSAEDGTTIYCTLPAASEAYGWISDGRARALPSSLAPAQGRFAHS